MKPGIGARVHGSLLDMMSSLSPPKLSGDEFSEALVRSSWFQTTTAGTAASAVNVKDQTSLAAIERVQRFMVLKRTVWNTKWLLWQASAQGDINRLSLDPKKTYKELADDLRKQDEMLVPLLKEWKPSLQDRKLAIEARIVQVSKIPTAEDLSRLLKVSAGLDEIGRVVNFACRTREGAERLMKVQLDLLDALWHTGNLQHTPQVAIFFNSIAAQLRSIVPKLSSDLVMAGMKYAIRSRSWLSLRRYLREYRDNGYSMSVEEFKSVVMKFRTVVIPILNRHRKYTTWMRNFRALLAGSKLADVPALPGDDEFSLRSFLPVGSSECLIVYLQALCCLGATEALWQEWLSWQKLPTNYPTSDRMDIIKCFIFELQSRDPVRAWKVVKDSGLTFDALTQNEWARLLGNEEAVCVLPKGIDSLLLQIYRSRLSKIEQALHVTWVRGEDGVDGYHVPTDEPFEDE